jgi:uncharacterized protein with gpF-like domain
MICNCGHKDFKRVTRQGFDIALKMKLEKEFLKDIKSFLLEVYSANKTMYARTGHIVGMTTLYNNFNEILKKHYTIIFGAFSGRVFKQIFEQKAPQFSQIEPQLKGQINQYINSHSEAQAKLILNNLEKDITEKIKNTTADLILKGEISNNEIVADIVTADLNNEAESKSEIIAITETSNIAEKTKNAEALIIEASAGAFGISRVLKIWNATLDSKTRASHAEADGQERRLIEPFNIGGESLMYPSEAGGSPANTINCRCSLTYTGE